MGRLLWVELRRVLARGITRVFVLLGAALIVLVGVLTFVFTEDAATARANRQARYEQMVEECVSGSAVRGRGGPSAIAPPGASPDPAMIRSMCERSYASMLESVDRVGFQLTNLWPGWDPAREGNAGFFDLLNAIVMLPALLLMLGGIFAGASMVGAEWQAGSLITLLTWEPRRARLFVARMIATAVVGAVITVALLGLFTLALLPTSAIKGAPVASDWWTTYAGAVARLSALTGLAAAAGAALGMIGRRTALALAAVFGYLILGELVLGLVWEASHKWLLLRNVGLVLAGEDLIPDGTLVTGLLVVLAYSGAVIAAALALFTRRDFASTS